jgi:hypothetical protein
VAGLLIVVSHRLELAHSDIVFLTCKYLHVFKIVALGICRHFEEA